MPDGRLRRARSIELRRRLEDSQARLSASIDELSHRAESHSNPLVIIKEHPIATAAAGVAVGYLLLRRPRWLFNSARRLAVAAIPYAASTLLDSFLSNRGSSEHK